MSSKPKAPDEIRWAVRRRRIPLAWSAHFDAARQICARWHCLFGGCLTVNDARLEAICTLLTSGVSLDAILAAIRGYHHLVTTDPWYRQGGRANPGAPAGTDAHKSLEDFLPSKQFDKCLEQGLCLQLAEQRQAAAPAGPSPMQAAQLYGRYLSLPAVERGAICHQAEADLAAQRRRITHDSTKARIIEIMASKGVPS